MEILKVAGGLAAATLIALVPATARADLLGPSAYLCFDRNGGGFTGSCGTSDSPFASILADGDFTFFHLETFQDHALNTPGVSASSGAVTSNSFSGTIIDSVDADDGAINNSGVNGGTVGDSFFGNGTTGYSFTFDAIALGDLPTHVGIVWVDGTNNIFFEAFDADGNSLGSLTSAHADGSFFGTTGEDRFYGATNAGGISRIFIRSGSGGIEVDHLQYGRLGAIVSPPGLPEPASLALFGVALAGLGAMRRARRS